MWFDTISGWSNLYLAKPQSGWGDDCPEAPGVYRLVAVCKDLTTLTPISILRICNHDETGTLYVGLARNLCGRLGQLVRSLSGTIEHGAGRLIHNTSILSRQFPVDAMAIAWAPTTHPADSESSLLDAYCSEFGEAPPLNRQHGTRDS